jgi:large subunit ribosomal protein L24
MSIFLKKNDTVKAIAGNSKGKEGKVLQVLKEKNAVIVEGLNMKKRHTKPSREAEKGGIFEKEAPIHISNVMLVIDGTPGKVVRRKNENGKTVRAAQKTGKVLG